MRNITLTNDFRRCVKRSHCSAAEVGRWAGNAPLGRSHFRCREWRSVFVNTNYHAPTPPLLPYAHYIELLENSLRKWICQIFIVTSLPSNRRERGQSTGHSEFEFSRSVVVFGKLLSSFTFSFLRYEGGGLKAMRRLDYFEALKYPLSKGMQCLYLCLKGKSE